MPINFSSIGIQSRGRIGLTSSQLNAGAIVNPWFVDSNDKATLITALQEIITASGNGKRYMSLENYSYRLIINT